MNKKSFNYPLTTTSNTQPRMSMFHVLMFSAFAAALLFTCHGVQADQLHLLLNGKAKHVNPRPNTDYNERNWGGGFEFDYGRRTSLWVPFVTVSGFIDSMENPSYYAGGGLLRRYLMSRKLDDMHVDVGMVSFVMTRQDFYDGRPFLGALPVLSIGTNKLALNVTYIPALNEKMSRLWFMQLKVSSNNFWK